MRVRNKQLVKYNGNVIPLPKYGDKCNGKTIVSVKVIGKPFKGMLNGNFYGLIQEYEMVLR